MALRILLISILIAVLSGSSYAQEQINTEWLRNDSDLREGLISERAWLDRQQQVLQHIHDHPESGVVKCLTPLFMRANKLDIALQGHAEQQYLARQKSASSSFLSQSGLFRIYYETTGTDAVPLTDDNANQVPDYVEWVAEAADSSYRHEILTLGFRDPIRAGTEYSVYIQHMGFYGFTVISSAEPAGTYIAIENDFVGFPENSDPEGDQKGAVKVTMAHEFKHAIQYVQNRWRGDSDQWAEMDATLYEELVYDDVNDYYNYLDGFANNLFIAPQTPIIPGSYEDITWALYFHDRFGDSFWTEVWEELERDPMNTPFLSAVSTTLGSYTLTFGEATTEAAAWHFASGPEFNTPAFGFEESAFYPAPRLRERYSDVQTQFPESFNISRFAANYFEYDLLSPVSELVQLNFSSSSADLRFALLGYQRDGGIRYRDFGVLQPDQEEEHKLDWSWAEFDRIGVVVFNHSSSNSASYQMRLSDYFPERISLSQNYPNPFNPGTTIPFTLSTPSRVRIEVYDVTGRLVRVVLDQVFEDGPHTARFDGSDLASGTYVYRLITDQGSLTRKMMLIK